MILQNKIDFAGIILANNCNPNGDPLNGNRPREDLDGHGIISDVALKRKIRDRFQEMGNEILVVENSRVTDGFYSIKARVDADEHLNKFRKTKDENGFVQHACSRWLDVRTFGQVFAYKGLNVSTSVRGPVSITMARSIEPISINEVGITKSTNSINDQNSPFYKDGTTFSSKAIVEYGVYVFYGGIFPQLAQKTGFSYEDAAILKNAMIHIFDNDASSSRPNGSMVMDRLFWWQHNSSIGQYSPAKIVKSLIIQPTKEAPYYDYFLAPLPGLIPEISDAW